ncbi:transposase, mutator family [mine drainage metagenome]|uniref:Transposase, mutator family n=1 Tax=mine drainage metagenome TaxID=410659 RepID=A0A1J5Q1Z4_9ZZZZ
MPSRAKKLEQTVAKLPSIPKELVAQFLTGPMTGEAINAAGIAFKQALIEASLNAELTHHLGYAPGAERPEASTNQRNGVTAKTVLTGGGRLRIETPRDRDGSFEPLLLPKHARRFTAFDDSIVALYARGLTVREIQGYLAEAYGTEVSPNLISTVTDGVLAEVTAWQARPLEPVYPVVFFDALRVKVREDNVVRNKAVYLALGVRRDNSHEILGLWIETTEGAKFWMKVFNDLKTQRRTSGALSRQKAGASTAASPRTSPTGAAKPVKTLERCLGRDDRGAGRMRRVVRYVARKPARHRHCGSASGDRRSRSGRHSRGSAAARIWP